jgi:hypothetical protein
VSVLADEIAFAVSALRRGDIVAYPTETFYGLGVDALDELALARLRHLKGRDEKAISVLVDGVDMLERVCLPPPPLARELMRRHWPGALTLVESFFNPTFLTPGTTRYTDIGAVLKGDADNNAQEMDEMGVSSIRNLLFGNSGVGEDLIARDLWRAHDNGIGTYNQVRIAYGLAPITDTGGGTFADYVEGQPFQVLAMHVEPFCPGLLWDCDVVEQTAPVEGDRQLQCITAAIRK